jgi:hypothetical protein
MSMNIEPLHTRSSNICTHIHLRDLLCKIFKSFLKVYNYNSSDLTIYLCSITKYMYQIVHELCVGEQVCTYNNIT